MDIKTALFYAFSAVLLIAALRVITARNPVHAALFLVLSFFSAACIWMLLKAEFLAIALVLVYVGAVMVLFLFVVMMLDIDLARLREGFWKVLPLASGIGLLIVVQIAAVLGQGFRGTVEPSAALTKVDNTKALGIALFGSYVFPSQIAAVVLLIAIIAAIALTLRRRKDVRSQSVEQQVRVRPTERLRIVKLEAQDKS